ncbi:hypothetical protein HKD37_16G046401 [Glycine soja]
MEDPIMTISFGLSVLSGESNRFRMIATFYILYEKFRTPLPGGSSLCEGMGEGYCTQPYPCICKEAVSRFEPMTNKSQRHNFTAVPGLVL